MGKLDPGVLILNLKHNPSPPYVYVGRGSLWGNPFRAGVDGSRSAVIARFEEYLNVREDLRQRLGELRGRNLACWCAPLPCHAEVLRRLANS